MRRFLLPIAGVGLAAFLFPGSATGDHVFPVRDALDCTLAPESFVDDDPNQDDRGAVCVSDGNPANGAELYVGGEAQTETAYADNPEHVAGDSCGAVVVEGQVQSATRLDDPATPEDERLDWDWQHLHDPDPLIIGDEFFHHHTCD